jgi:rod shape-determining protein MreD
LEKEQHSSTRILKIAGCLLMAAFAQTTLTNVQPWLGYIDWLLLVTIYISLMREPAQAMLTGTAAGLLQDASSALPIGVSGMAKVLAAYAAYWVSSKVYVEGLLVRLLTVAGASVIHTLTRLLFYRMLKLDLPPLAGVDSMTRAVALAAAANLLVSLPLFPALDRLFRYGARQRIRRAEAMRGMRKRRWKKTI